MNEEELRRAFASVPEVAAPPHPIHVGDVIVAGRRFVRRRRIRRAVGGSAVLFTLAFVVVGAAGGSTSSRTDGNRVDVVARPPSQSTSAREPTSNDPERLLDGAATTVRQVFDPEFGDLRVVDTSLVFDDAGLARLVVEGTLSGEDRPEADVVLAIYQDTQLGAPLASTEFILGAPLCAPVAVESAESQIVDVDLFDQTDPGLWHCGSVGGSETLRGGEMGGDHLVTRSFLRGDGSLVTATLDYDEEAGRIPVDFTPIHEVLEELVQDPALRLPPT